jgi:hypothetical protein
MKILLLQSKDGGEWAWPVVIPEGMDGKKAYHAARRIIEQARIADPGNYSQVDIEKLLIEAGFQCPAYADGPFCD